MKAKAKAQVTMTRTIIRTDGTVERDPHESFRATVAYWWRKLRRRFH
jgi:hypothetical protein